MRISDWSSDVCSSDLLDRVRTGLAAGNDRRLGRLDRIDFQIGPMRLERFGHPGDVPAGADAGDDDVDRRVAEILEDLARGGAGVDFDIGRVLELLRHPAKIERASCRERECQYV